MPQVAELKEIDGSVWARVPMELGSPIQILAPAEIEENRKREVRRLDEIERLRAALKDIQRESMGVKPPRHSWYYDRAEDALNQQETMK